MSTIPRRSANPSWGDAHEEGGESPQGASHQYQKMREHPYAGIACLLIRHGGYADAAASSTRIAPALSRGVLSFPHLGE